MDGSAAETLALKGLGFLASDGDALVRFLTMTGVNIDDLRIRAEMPELLAAVLDFLLADDALLQDFCASIAADAQTIHAARRALPGAAPE